MAPMLILWIGFHQLQLQLHLTTKHATTAQDINTATTKAITTAEQ